MRLMGIWRIQILPLILMMTLLGTSGGIGTENPTPGTGHYQNANPLPPGTPETPATAPTPAIPATPKTQTSATPAMTQGQTCPPTIDISPSPGTPKLHLRSFKIVGNKTISTKDIEKELSEKLPRWWPPWGKPPEFRLQDLEYDVDRLKNYYRDQGFYHTKIKPEMKCGTSGNVDVTLVIHEGPWVKITSINVVNKGKIDLSSLRDKWPLAVGDRFTEGKYGDLKNLYLNYLPDHGHPKVKVIGRVRLNEKTNTAKIRLTVKPGPLCYFGPVNIKDEEKLETPAAAIREKITFKVGQVFNAGELFNTQRNLYATDLFRSVVLKSQPVPEKETSIPIDVELAEKKKRSLKVGLGYANEEKVRARLGLRYRNLWGGGRVLDLDARYSSLGYTFNEVFTNPAVGGSHFDFTNQSGALQRNFPSFTDRSVYIQSRFEHNLPWNFKVYFGHGIEWDRAFGLPYSTLILLDETRPENIYRSSYALLGIRQDTVDNPANPRSGGYFEWGNQIAPVFLGSNMQFAQTVLDIKRYQAIAKSDFVIAGRTRVGLIQPMQQTHQIAISRLFFAGGENSNRGYPIYMLSPRDAQNNPYGGASLLELSLELRFPIPVYKNIVGLVFVDAGNVYRRAIDFNPLSLKYSPGFGLRYVTPVGAIGVDIAFPANRINYVADRWYQINFSVGYGF
jgi:outer membrane protein assembly complex protein YaeT